MYRPCLFAATPRFTVPKFKLQQKLIALPVGNSAKLDLSADGYPTQGCMVQEWKTVK